MVGLRTLDPPIGVQIPASQPSLKAASQRLAAFSFDLIARAETLHIS